MQVDAALTIASLDDVPSSAPGVESDTVPAADRVTVAAERALTRHGMPPASKFRPLTAFTPPGPGAYRFTLTLSTDSGRPEDWLGPLTREPDRAAVLDLVRLVPPVTVTSAPLVVEVR